MVKVHYQPVHNLEQIINITVVTQALPAEALETLSTAFWPGESQGSIISSSSCTSTAH